MCITDTLLVIFATLVIFSFLGWNRTRNTMLFLPLTGVLFLTTAVCWVNHMIEHKTCDNEGAFWFGLIVLFPMWYVWINIIPWQSRQTIYTIG